MYSVHPFLWHQKTQHIINTQSSRNFSVWVCFHHHIFVKWFSDIKIFKDVDQIKTLLLTHCSSFFAPFRQRTKSCNHLICFSHTCTINEHTHIFGIDLYWHATSCSKCNKHLTLKNSKIMGFSYVEANPIDMVWLLFINTMCSCCFVCCEDNTKMDAF